MQRALYRSVSALLLAALTLLASVGLWVAMPLGWLWVAGRMQGITSSVGAAIVIALVGVLVSVVLIVSALGWLNRKRLEYRDARGLPEASGVALEAVMVVSALLAAVLFSVWFLFFAGAQPFPINLPS